MKGIWVDNNLSPHFLRWHKRHSIMFHIGVWGAFAFASLVGILYYGTSEQRIVRSIIVILLCSPIVWFLYYFHDKKHKWLAPRKVKIMEEGIELLDIDGSVRTILWKDIVKVELFFPPFLREGGDDDVGITYRKWGYSGAVVSREIGKEIIERWRQYRGLAIGYERKKL
ncbi:MAG: hypothetical protein QXU48_02185 [Thermoplasmata archaeon]